MGGTLSSFIQFWQTSMSLALRFFLKLHLKKKHKTPQMNLTERLTDMEKEWCLLGGGRAGRGMGWEFGVSGYKLCHLGWINNKVLVYTQGTIFNILE